MAQPRDRLRWIEGEREIMNPGIRAKKFWPDLGGDTDARNPCGTACGSRFAWILFNFKAFGPAFKAFRAVSWLLRGVEPLISLLGHRLPALHLRAEARLPGAHGHGALVALLDRKLHGLLHRGQPGTCTSSPGAHPRAHHAHTAGLRLQQPAAGGALKRPFGHRSTR